VDTVSPSLRSNRSGIVEGERGLVRRGLPKRNTFGVGFPGLKVRGQDRDGLAWVFQNRLDSGEPVSESMHIYANILGKSWRNERREKILNFESLSEAAAPKHIDQSYKGVALAYSRTSLT